MHNFKIASSSELNDILQLMKPFFRPESNINGIWYCHDTNDCCIAAIYQFQNGLGTDTYSVTWFVNLTPWPELESSERFLSLESAEQYIMLNAPKLGYKMLGDHYKTLLD